MDVGREDGKGRTLRELDVFKTRGSLTYTISHTTPNSKFRGHPMRYWMLQGRWSEARAGGGDGLRYALI